MKLNKYQLGGGTEQSDQYAMLATSIQQAILRGQTPQSVYESLVARKMEQKMALQLVSSVVQQMLENGSLEEEDLQQSKQKDAAAEKALLEDQQLADAETEKDNAAEEQMNTYNQQSSDVALDTSGIDQEEEDLNSMYSNYQYGFQAGGATEEDIYNSQFAEEENKEEPFSMESLLKSTPGTQNFNFAGIQDYYMPYSPIGSSSDLQFVDFSNTSQAKYGGSHKKQFAKNVLNLLKKAEGGPQEDEVTDTNNAVQTDDLLGTVQKKQSSFVDAMGNTAKKIKIDEWFDKLKEVGDPMLDQILNPVPEEDPVQQQQQQVDQMLGQEEEMRFGGGKKRKQKRQYNRILNQANRLLGLNDFQSMVNRQLPFGNLPTNQYSKFNNFTDQRFDNIDAPALQKYFIDLAKQQLAQQQDNVLMPSIDVYDRGLFGRAKKYRVSYPQPAPKSAEVQAEEVVVKNNDILKNALEISVKNNDPIKASTNTEWQNSSRKAEKASVDAADKAYADHNFDNDYVPSGMPDFEFTPGIHEDRKWSSPINQVDYINVDDKIRNEKGEIDWKAYKNLSQEEKDKYNQYSYLQKDSKGNEYSVMEGSGTPEFEAEEDRLINDYIDKESLYDLNQRFSSPGYANGGFVDSQNPDLYNFVYGGDDSYGESKNVDDPYFSDMTSNFIPQAQDGWITGPGHFLTKEELALAQEYGINDPNFDPEGSRREIKSNQRNTWIDGQMNGNSNGYQGSSNNYLGELQNILGNKRNIKKNIRNQRRANNTTARDYLFPANRGIYYAGSYAQQQGMPFIAGTNYMYPGSMANMPLHSRNVTKTGIFGRPKQWTDYYGTGTGTSNKQEEIKLNKEYANEEEYFADQRPDYSDLNPITQMRLNSADRKMDRQTARGERNDMNQPMEGPITLYDDLKLLKKDKKEGENWRGTPNWRQEPRTEDKVFKENNIQEIKITPKREYTDEEIGIDPRTYDDLMKDKRARKLQDGGSPEENFNFYDELENTMYDYEPDAYPFSYQIGGYLPKANLGLADTPVSYSNNPAFVGQAEVDWTGSGQDMFNTGLQSSSFWADQQSFNVAPPINSNQGELPTQYNIDPNQAEEYQTKKQWDPNALIGINRKRKDMTGVDPQAALETGNASADFVLGKIDQSKNADSQAQFYDQNFDPMNLYGKKDRIDKGDYETNIGGYRLNETGSNRLGRSKQYGGGMYDEYLENEEDYLLDDEEDEVNEYKKGGEKITFMSEKQIKAFLASGGELKFI